MKLLVSCIPYDGGKSGISVYTREVVRALAAQGHELALLCEPSGVPPSSAAEMDVQERVHPVIHAPRWTRRPALSMMWHLFVLPFWIRWHRRDFDGFVICAANRRVCAFYPLPTAATVHDLANFHVPGKYSRARMFYLAHVLPFFAKRAQRLVAVSGATKADMVTFWHCREEDVTVLYNGLRTSDFGLRTMDFGQRTSDFGQRTSDFGQRTTDNGLRTTDFGLRDSDLGPGSSDGGWRRVPGSQKSGVGSLLYISRIEHPGKNHVRLIEAYSRLPRALAQAHPLVLAGADWKDAEAVHSAAAASPHADLIRFTGFVPDGKLERLWGEAGFYVFPSLFEGFGLSLVEAMARGIPCACSGNGSLGEIAADVAITFDPESVDEIADALLRLVSEPEQEIAARVARGLERARRFSWADHAKGLASLIGDCRHEARTASLFGIPVAKTTEAEAVERIVAIAKERHSPVGGRQPGGDRQAMGGRTRPAFAATLNVDFVCNAVSCWPFGGNGELWEYLKNADLVTADGMPIVLLSRLLRRSLPERVTGADMVPAICRRCAEEGLSVYVLGGDEGAVKEAFARLDIDSLRVAGVDSSFVKLDEVQPEVISRINAAKPDILFVALGNPKQELWMGRNAAKLDVGVMIGVGGTFNFIAGRVKRAPRWMQKCGLEWTYRILQEPGRLWRRYAYGLAKFSWLSLLHLAGGFRE